MSGVIKTLPKAAFLKSVQMICTITEDLRAPVADIASFIFTAKTNNPAFSREAAKALSQVVREHGGVATYQRGIERELEKMRAVNPESKQLSANLRLGLTRNGRSRAQGLQP